MADEITIAKSAANSLYVLAMENDDVVTNCKTSNWEAKIQYAALVNVIAFYGEIDELSTNIKMADVSRLMNVYIEYKQFAHVPLIFFLWV